LYDSELRIIQDLGPASRSKAIADGAIATMKALEVVAALNNVCNTPFFPTCKIIHNNQNIQLKQDVTLL
jgi:hypothetical protein